MVSILVLFMIFCSSRLAIQVIIAADVGNFLMHKDASVLIGRSIVLNGLGWQNSDVHISLDQWSHNDYTEAG